MTDHERPVEDPALREAQREALVEEFSAFYRATVPGLVGFLVNQGATLSVAADVAQETLIKAYQRWSDLDNPRAWAHRVASRALIRRIAEVREEPVERVPEPTSLLPRPDAAAEWETRHDILRALVQLPYRQRQVMAWTLGGYTPAEIAEELGMTPEAVRASLLKARRAAVAQLREEDR
ncbi:RNA polymerase sigma factor [Streptomyces radicis]|uniref:Sigma-70 family RNA polymerase sigma factor n=1 Tax=Streptomyces radicis TaxID=1750517 RepID=A0A3A9WH09_9ACTN|nr:sigma-70 family RNA polymerase sigma factor [Streptomyces radicis]RKN05397.1 sigma-70 family RNA polymerase sigma factor [Streptomyces radicis]RKN16905.1 sigma-70 family RNA polymerase sigma factor [Streptomyces radicis]